MIINNFVFYFSFYLLFMKFKFIWWFNFDKYSLLLGFIYISVGISLLFFWWSWTLTYNIPLWKLDHYLLLPKNILLLILTSNIHLSAIWEIISWLVLISFYKNLSFIFFLKLVIFTFLSSILFVSFLITINSLWFWIWRSSKISKWLREAIIWPSLYPYGIFKNTILYIVLFTIIPTWIRIWWPLELTIHFEIVKFIYFMLALIWWIWLALFVFYKWLKRYESWNLVNINI